MNNKKTITYLIIFVAFMLIIIGGATFAFFASTQDINANLPANITTASKTYTFVASADGEINFHLSAQDMSEDNVNENYIMADNGLINVEVASANDGEITRCTYDIAWVWDSADKYIESDVELPYEKDEITYPYELSVSVDGVEEKDLSTFTLDSNNSFVIASGLTSIATSTMPVIDSHKIEVKAYNIPIDQQNLFNKNFQAHMEVRNINCNVVNIDLNSNQLTLQSGNFYDALTIATYDTTSNFTDTDSTTYSGKVVSENGLRFEGKNPNNYVQFNDELWRIIGVFDENTHGRAGEQLVKLIRAESLPQYYRWSSNNRNNWNNASLKTTLNTNYYNNNTINACSNYNGDSCSATTVANVGIKSDGTRNMIQPIHWKLGSSSTGLVNEAYASERSNLLPSSEGATAISIEELPIGLMYPSDYGYAVLASDCARTITIGYGGYNNNSNCYEKNWIYNSKYSWMISSRLNDSIFVYHVSSNGYVSDGNDAAFHMYTVYPVLYLRQNIQIANGLGTKANPYTLQSSI